MAQKKTEYILRLRTSSGMKRIEPIDGASCTLDMFKLQIESMTGIPVHEQILSRAPPNSSTITAHDDATLGSLNLKHGDIIVLSVPEGSTSVPRADTQKTSTSISSLSFKITPQCQHGPRGRCLYCDAVPPGATPIITGSCNHASSATCIHCSKLIKERTAEAKKPASERETEHLADWLCTHPPNVFCPKCLPPEEVAEDDKKTKIDVKPFKQVLAERRALCKFRHGPTVTCAMCAPPKQPSFTGLASCDRGHQPWPRGVCTHCAPPTAVLRPQEYRHVDGISLPAAMVQGFYRRWTLDDRREVMRCGILFGKVIDETSDIENPDAMRAVVSALYEPPQKRLAGGVRLLRDDGEARTLQLAASAGLVPVGWIITAGPRPDKPQYGGKAFISGLEVCIAATLQEKYGHLSSSQSFSQFVTVILEEGPVVEPHAYMVSDQCQALVRDGCLLPGEDPFLVRSRPAERGELVPKVVYHDRSLEAGAEFLPDNFLVKVRVMTSDPSSYSFAFYEFPSRVAANEQLLQAFLRAHADEPYGLKLSDFNVLAFLEHKEYVNRDVIHQVAHEIASSPGGVASLSPQLCNELDSAFLAKGLL